MQGNVKMCKAMLRCVRQYLIGDFQWSDPGYNSSKEEIEARKNGKHPT